MIGKLYKLTGDVSITTEKPQQVIPEIDLVITEAETLPKRKLRARWGPEMAQDLEAFYALTSRKVPAGSIVLIVALDPPTKSVKVIFEDFIGWLDSFGSSFLLPCH